MLSTVPIPTFIFEVGCLLVVCRFMVPSVKRVARHVPVLLGQVVRFMVGESPITGRGVFVDATFGSGGHSKSLLESGAQCVYAIDRDEAALQFAYEHAAHLAPGQSLVPLHGPFSDAVHLLKDHGVQPGMVDGVLMDLGTSAMQLGDAERGFSFSQCGPLDMRMDPSQSTTAADLVNQFTEEQLSNCLLKYGEERMHRVIAKAIVREREKCSFATTHQLATVVEQTVGWQRRRRLKDALNRQLHPATRTFQALRIAVNNEMEELIQGLSVAAQLLCDGGRLVVISYHSLEDRIVKRFMAGECAEVLVSQKKSRGYQLARRRALRNHRNQQDWTPHNAEISKPQAEGVYWTFQALHRKIITAGPDEVSSNPRARSAKLRAAIKTVIRTNTL